jgi:LPS sulfotransferase NodH
MDLDTWKGKKETGKVYSTFYDMPKIVNQLQNFRESSNKWTQWFSSSTRTSHYDVSSLRIS